MTAMKEKKIVLFLGVPGVGKGAVLGGVPANSNWIVKNFGTLMMEIAAEKGIKDRDELRKQPAKLQKEIQLQVGKRLAESKENIILDTHISVFNATTGYLPGLPEYILKGLNVTQIVVVTASPDEIMARRGNDKTRNRNDQTKEQLIAHLEYNDKLVATYSTLTGAPVKYIINSQGKVEQAQKEFAALLN